MTVNKHILVFLVIFNSILANTEIVEKNFTHSMLANLWTQEYLTTATPQDLQLIVNLVYFSYLKSKKTIEAQDIALHHLDTSWNYWQNIVQTRLDPTTILPHPLSAEKYSVSNSGQMLEDTFKEYMSTGKIYSQVVNTVINLNNIQDSNAKIGINRLRSASRVIVAKAILVCWKEVLHFIKHAVKKTANILDTLETEIPDDISDEALKSIFNFAPQLAVYMFAQSDKEYAALSEKCWHAFYTTQDMSITLWKTIETDRSELYKAYYNTIYNYMKSHNIANSFITQAFDENGLIPENKRIKSLPSPEELN